MTTYWLNRIWPLRPTAFSPRKVPQFAENANFLSAGSALPPSAIAIAVPSNACLICVCKVLTLDCKVAISCELETPLKAAVARLPAASVVTTLIGPDCAERLAAEATPDSL